SADVLTGHLASNVDVTVNPCDNFFLHVCSQAVNESEFLPFTSAKFYQDYVKKFFDVSQSRNIAIMNDAYKLNDTLYGQNQQFNRSVFEQILRSRCHDDNSLREEFHYFHGLYKQHRFEHIDRVDAVAEKLNETSGEEIIAVLSAIVESFNGPLIGQDLFSVTSLYRALSNRLFVLEAFEKEGLFEKVVNIDVDVQRIKRLIIDKFRNTPWMNKNEKLLSEYESTIEKIKVQHDLDKHDQDLGYLRSINSKYNQLYYQAKAR
ncbi:hypothetical protein PMAYCL1PPCAC_33288, partial [Pristionchus mayeri]